MILLNHKRPRHIFHLYNLDQSCIGTGSHDLGDAIGINTFIIKMQMAGDQCLEQIEAHLLLRGKWEDDFQLTLPCALRPVGRPGSDGCRIGEVPERESQRRYVLLF